MADRKNIDPRRPVPASGYDRLRTNMESNFKEGFPTIKGGFPGPDNRPAIGKGNENNRKNDTIKDVSIGLQDHDEAIMYYFDNVIKPSVLVNGNRTNVPLIYGSPERWKSVQQDGFYRDKEGKIQTPLIMFKRDSVERRRDLGNKIDANNPQLYYTFQERYSKKNTYDNFSVLQGRKPQKEMYTVVIPDYVTLTYTCTIWTDYVAQMNKLIEMINYTSNTYWGDPEKFKFNATIDSYNNQTELSQGEDRVVKTDFGLKIQGYLVPDTLNKHIIGANMRKSYSRSIVTFNTELSVESTGIAQTREEVRSQPLGQNIKQTGNGVGFQQIGLTNAIG
tara:strand:- start:595 stop:1596 length:1002 start_codon:yes stop_codon:yes gene_type:complete